MQSTVETTHAEHGGDSACRAHAMETAHAEHMPWRQRVRSTCDGDSACRAHALETAHAEHMR